MKESLPKSILGLRETETPQENSEKKLSLEEIEKGLKYAEDTGRLLEKAYWDDERDKYFKAQGKESKEVGDVKINETEIVPKIQRSTPIEWGSCFDPEEELAKIKLLPQQEKPKVLKEYREKLAYQQEGLAKTQEQLIETIRRNPDISFNELSDKVIPEGVLNYGLTGFQVDTIKD